MIAVAAYPARPRFLAAAGVVSAAVVVAATEPRIALTTLSAAFIVASCLLFDVDLPRGGTVPLGHAVIIAMSNAFAPSQFAVVTALGLLAAWPISARRDGSLGSVARIGGAAAGAIGALSVRSLFPDSLLAGEVSPELAVLLEVVVSGAAFLAADVAVRARVGAAGYGTSRVTWSTAVHGTLLCASALLAIAWYRSPSLALVAAVPLLATQYSFRRYSKARDTYRQTIRALSLLPEVAGLTSLGHAERTAYYSATLARAIGVDAGKIDLIATAARLHHIGHISLHEPEERKGPIDPHELGRVGADILRETGFLDDAASIVENVPHPGTGTIEAAIVRVCCTLDDLAERSLGRDPLVETLRLHPDGLDRRAAIGLLRLQEQHPVLVEDARLQAAELALAEAEARSPGHRHDHDHDHSGGLC